MKALYAVIIIAALSACATTDRYQQLLHQETPEPPEKNVLRIASSWGGQDVRSRVFREAIAKFLEQNPDIEIINESIAGEDFLLKLKTDFASGNQSDLFAMWTGADLISLINQGKVADLTELLAQNPVWAESFDKSTWRHVTYNQRIYGLPLEVEHQWFFVNLDLFKRAGVQIPASYTELKDAVIKFREVDIIPIANNYTSDGSMLYQSLVAMLGGEAGVRDIENAANPQSCYVKAFDYLKELHEIGAFPDNALALDNQGKDALFLEKNAAMIVQRSSFIGEINKNPNILPNDGFFNGEDDITVSLHTFPNPEQGEADPTAIIYGLGTGTFFVSQSAWEHSQKQQAAVRFLKYITSEQIAFTFAEEARMLSAIKIEPPSAYYSGLIKSVNLLINDTKESMPFPDSMMNRFIWMDMIVDQIPYVLEGKADAVSVLGNAVTAQKRQGE